MFKHYISLSKLLSFTLISMSLLALVFESNAQRQQSQTSATNKEISFPWSSRKDLKSEVITARNRHTKTFVKTDGTFSMYSSSGPLHYETASGWKEINVGIGANATGSHSSNPYFNGDNAFKTYYPQNPLTGLIYTRLKEGEYSEKIEAFYAEDQNGNVVYQFLSNPAITAVVEGAEITYPQLFDQTSVKYTQGSDGRKFDLILQNQQMLNALPANAAFLVIKEKLNMPNGWQMQAVDGGFQIKAGGNCVAFIPKAIAYENENSGKSYEKDEDYKNEATMDMTQNGNELTLYTRFALSWLKDPARSFPVRLDPVTTYSVAPGATMVSGYMTTPTGAKVSGTPRLTGAGTSCWVTFDISLLPPGATIAASTLYGYHFNGANTPPKIAAYVGMQAVDPRTAINTAIYNQIITTGPVYNATDTFAGPAVNVWYPTPLTGTSSADFISQIAQGWTAIGMRFVSGNNSSIGIQQGFNATTVTLRPYLEIDYSTSACTGTPIAGTPVGPTSVCTTPFNLNLSGNSTGSGLSYQWQSSPAGAGTWTDLGLPQASPIYTTSQTAATDYRCFLVCSNSSASDTSTVISVGQNAPVTCYCTPSGPVSATYYISGLTTTNAAVNIANTGTGYGSTSVGYSNFTNLTISANPGSTVNYTMTFVGGNQFMGVYADWNQDGDFTDPGDTIIFGSTAVPSPFNGSFVVPATAVVGNTRFRIRASFGGSAPACGSITNGEAEDYTLNVLGPCSNANAGTITPASASICPVTSYTITASVPTTQLGTTYQWKESSTSGGPYTNVVGGTAGSPSATSRTYVTPTLSAGTYYYVLETSCANCGPCSTLSNEIVINVSDVPAPIGFNSAQCAPGVPTASVVSNAGAAGAGIFNWYSAASGGTLLQGQPYGPVQSYYTNDYDTPGVIGNALLFGGSSQTGNAVQLHANSVSAYGGLLIRPPVPARNFDKIQVDFDYTTIGTAAMAEGFSYSLGNDVDSSATNVASMNAENGTGSKLKLCFVALTNGISTQGIYLIYNNSVTNEPNPTTTGVLAYSNNVTWKGASGHVTLFVDSLGKITMTLNSTVIFNQVQIPTGASLNSWLGNKSTWKSCFKGRAGTNTMSTVLDNIDIKISNLTTGSTSYQSSVATTTTFYVSEVGTNSCLSPRTPVTVTVNTPATIVPTAIPNDSVCTGGPVTLSASGGVSYLWNGNATSVNGDTTFATAIPGIYTVTGTDANSCINTATINIYLLPVISGVSSASPDTLCLGSSASLSAAATPICDGLNLSGFQNFYHPGNWTFTSFNNNGTLNTAGLPDSIILSIGTNATADSGSIMMSKVITCSGTLSFNWKFTFGDCPYTNNPRYWINGSFNYLPGFDFSASCGGGTQTGTFTVSVVEGDTFKIENYTLDNSFLGNLTLKNFSAPSPKLTGVASIWSAATGGTNLGTPPLSVTPANSGITTYYAEYTTVNSGCVNLNRQPIDVYVNSAPTATVSGGGAVCTGSTLPNVDIQLTGTPPWSLTYTDGTTSTTLTNIASSPYTIMNATAGTYSVTSVADSNCTGTGSGSAMVSLIPLPTATVSGGGTVCSGSTLPDVTITLTGTSPWSLTYTDGTTPVTVNNIVSSPYTISNATAGTYEVTAIADSNCTGTSTGTATVVVNSLPLVGASASVTTTCANTSVVLTGSGAVTYAWSDGRTDNTPFSISNTTTFTVTGTDANNCEASSTVEVIVTPAAADLSNASAGNSSSLAGTSSGPGNQPAASTVNYYTGGCNLIASIVSTFALGATTSNVTVDTGIMTYNGQPFLRRWFEITPTIDSGATVTFYFTQDDFDDYNLYAIANGWPSLPTGPLDVLGIANLRITKNSNSGPGSAAVVLTPNSVIWNTTNSYWAVEVTVSSFSQFRVHAANPLNSALSANITRFTGWKEPQHNVLQWTSSSEQNNAYYNLQHSTDGVQFTTIAKLNTLAPGGNSQINLQYQAIHEEPSQGHNYYRLEQVDINDKKLINTNLVDLVWTNGGSLVTLYPNPANSELHLNWYTEKGSRATIKIMDISGRLVKQVDAILVVGTNEISIDIDHVRAGLYTVQVFEHNQAIQTLRFRKD